MNSQKFISWLPRPTHMNLYEAFQLSTLTLWKGEFGHKSAAYLTINNKCGHWGLSKLPQLATLCFWENQARVWLHGRHWSLCLASLALATEAFDFSPFEFVVLAALIHSFEYSSFFWILQGILQNFLMPKSCPGSPSPSILPRPTLKAWEWVTDNDSEVKG